MLFRQQEQQPKRRDTQIFKPVALLIFIAILII